MSVVDELRQTSAYLFAHENRPTGMTLLLDEAADEIEQLRDRVRFLESEYVVRRRQKIDAEAEVEQLRTALEQIAGIDRVKYVEAPLLEVQRIAREAVRG